ncbi:hypothetical protein WMF39_42400 [Sorangium sp. So ce1504]|uniref:hypothetical protein n=1 Tax=Sorangium sp. So ce1504 TaxID=3133337 RepID=UPI003F6240A5
MSPEMLWNRVRQCFETNDGSLPTVELQNLTNGEVADLYSSIRRGSHVVSRDATFWDTQATIDRGLDEVPNAALLVSTGQASPFHFAIEGASACEVTIPCLGVHVFQDTIAFDYRMGAEWGGQQVFALFSWLEHLLSRTRAGVLAPSANEGPPDPEAFMLAWKLFREWSAGGVDRE